MSKKLVAVLRGLSAVVLMLFATNFLPILAATQSHVAAGSDKVFVCKYTGTPGVNETLQTGNNPISVSVNAIKDFHGIGSYFNDGQNSSYVLAYDTRTGGGQGGEPSISECPQVPANSATAAPATSEDACGTDNDTITIPTVDHVYYTINGNTVSGTLPAAGSTTVVAHAEDGYTLTAEYSHTFNFTNETCTQSATAAPATSEDACGTDNDTITIPTVDHVYYTINGNTVSGTLPAAGSTTVVAHAEDGYTLTAEYSHTFNFTNETCDSGEVAICHATGEGTDGKFVLIEHLSAAGAYNGHLGTSHQHGRDIIPPFAFNGNIYSQNWDTIGQAIFRAGCNVPEQQPTQVNPAVSFTESNCENASGRVTVTTTAGVTYKVNGTVVTGTTSYAAGSSVTVTVELAQGYALASGAHGSFSHVFSAAPTGCVLGLIDVCPNVPGDQSTVPAGMTKDKASGNCITTMLTGGRGGDVLGASTTELANTGQSTLGAIIVGLMVIGLTLAASVATRRQYRLDA